jgi:hypothetical protein
MVTAEGGVLLPQQHQRHAFAAQFLVHATVVGRHETAGALGRSDQPVLQGALSKRPAVAS